MYNNPQPITPTEHQKRWRLILGSDAENICPSDLSAAEIGMDKALAALYETPPQDKRRGGLGASAPKISAWLGDIREYFPQSVVQIMQKDAIERLNLKTLLTEKEMLANITPDVHLVATLMSLSSTIPEKTVPSRDKSCKKSWTNSPKNYKRRHSRLSSAH